MTQSAVPARWDIARAAANCFHCPNVIGQGEAFRHSAKVVGRKVCEACSIRLHNEPAPTDLQAKTFLDLLREELNAAPKGHMVAHHDRASAPLSFAKFDRGAVAADVRGAIVANRQKPHVGDAPRLTTQSRPTRIEMEYRRAAAGERDE